jgi:hypothetical protein
MNKEPKKDKALEKWTPEQEELLAEWAEKASGYRWLHSRSEKLYRKRNYTFTIPVIILSTLTGTANFAMDSFVPEEHKQVAMACVGGVNIFAGILSTLQNFLRYAELMEGHRVSEVSWSKFSREISVELALNPKMRKPAVDFLNVCRAEYDRLIEQSPTIDDSIIIQYKKTFKNTDINHPHVCNGLHKCKVYELSENEKAAAIVAHAGEKFKLKHTLHHIKDNLQQVAENHHIHHKSINTQHTNDLSEKKNENMKELDSLKEIGKVSGLKNKINPHNTFDTHQEELKTLIIPDKSNENNDKSKDLDSPNENKEHKTIEHNKKITGEGKNTEKKNIKVSINLDDEELKEGEYELFKGSLNKKDKKIDGDIFLVEKKELNKDDITENIIGNDDIIIEVNDTEINDTDINDDEINDDEINDDDTDSIEANNNMKDFLDEIK